GHLANNIILEPIGRNTAPAVALAALEVSKQDPQAVLLVLAADHIIKDVQTFKQAILEAYNYCIQDKLVTFGIVPQCAETGYGYIKKGPCLANKTFKVERFVEKPDLATAQHYLQTDDYLWNSGMFMFKAEQYLKELKQYRPDILTTCEAAMANIHSDLDFVRVDKEAFSKCPSESIDYAVM